MVVGIVTEVAIFYFSEYRDLLRDDDRVATTPDLRPAPTVSGPSP